MDTLDFCNKLEGFYDNWFQAARDPARCAHIKLRYKKLNENEFSVKQWYHYLGEENAYRHRWSKIVDEGDRIRVENWDPNWESHNSCCDMLFYLVGDHYTGEVATNNCIVNGGTVKSVVEFDGKVYKSMDQGWNNNKRVWGSEMIYEFKKTDKPLSI